MLRKAVSQAILKTRINKNPPPSGFFVRMALTIKYGGHMGWQGVPFKVLTDAADTLNLQVSALPDLVLKSNSDYRSAILTAGVSLLAGIIPAGIAIFTFYKNSKNLRLEREVQHDFLKKEREEQQRFLKEERAAQTASMEADRKNQKEIAEKNFNMQVLSVNRQAWINKLRELLTEYMAISQDFLTAQFEFLNRNEYYKSISNKKQTLNNSGVLSAPVNDSYAEASASLQKAIDRLQALRLKEKLLTGSIKLMLNPSEKWYQKFSFIFRQVSIIYNSLDTLEQTIYLEKIRQMSEQTDACLELSQDLLKYEWERVKKGE